MLALLMMIPTCGYSFLGGRAIAGGVSKISIAPFSNQTTEAHVGADLTNAVRKTMQGSPLATVVSEDEKADASLSGEIRRFDAVAIALSDGSALVPFSTDLIMVVSVELRSANGKPLWSAVVQERQSFLEVSSSVSPRDHYLMTESNRRRVVARLTQKVAQSIYEKMTQAF